MLFSFTGCRTGDLRASSEATKEMEAAANILIQCLDNKDVDMLTGLLSEAALQTSDLDEGIAYTFSIYEGPSASVKQASCKKKKKNRPDGNSITVDGNYTITTEQGKTYGLYLEFVSIHEWEPEKLGVNRVEIYDKEQENIEDIKPPYQYACSGVYNPAWEDEPDRLQEQYREVSESSGQSR